MNNKKDVFAQVNAPRRSQLIEQQIRDAILSEHYKVGEKLPPERELAELFGASRTIVREALRSIERSGLLTIKTGAWGGAFVTEVGSQPIMDTMNDMIQSRHITHEEILQVRLFLEPPAAAEAAKKVTAKDVKRLHYANQVLEEGFRSGDVIIEHNPEPNLHQLIAEITGNRLLVTLMEVLTDITTQRFSHIKLDDETQRAVAEGHINIVRAIEQKDEKAAFDIMKQHVLTVYETHTALENSKLKSKN